MPEMLRLVRVRRGIFDQDPAALGFGQSPLREQRRQIGDRVAVERSGLQSDIHERLDRLRRSDILMGAEEVCGLRGELNGIFPEQTGETETVHGHISAHSLRAEFRNNAPSGLGFVFGIVPQEPRGKIGNAAKFHNEKTFQSVVFTTVVCCPEGTKI